MTFSKKFLPFIIIVLVIIAFITLQWIDFSSYQKVDKLEYSSVEIKKESCLNCHINNSGFSAYHNPKNIGCVACHLGNPKAIEKEASHKDMVLIPGNLSDADKTCGKCHKNELHKIKHSLMTTNSGLVAVDKFIFGEADTPDGHYHITEIGFTGAEKHLRDLCVNCHLGAEKSEFGKIDQLSRGGGCNACHLNYSAQAEKDLEKYINSDKKELPKVHPSTDIFVTNEHCFGCHSRSSRISTNYEGWHETLINAGTLKNHNKYRILEGNRVYTKKQEDVHHSKGMLCIDCHSSHEVMGDGKKYAHEEQAVKLQCADCHFKDKPTTIPYDSLDVESLKVFLHRNYSHQKNRILVAKKDHHPLVNTFVDSLGNAFLIGKYDGTLFELKPQSNICSRDNAHKNVACSTCHSSWTSRCIGCHNEFDKDETKAFDLLDRKLVKGQWKEYVAEFSSSLPAMGVRENEEERCIEPAIPV